jgi:translocation and assembly module TamB
VFPSSTGSLISQGQFSGANDQPLLQATASFNQFIFDAFDIEKLNISANVHLTPNGKTDLRLIGKNVQWNKYFFKDADIFSGGTVFHHTITAKMAGRNSNVYLSIAGNFSKNGWDSTIKQFDLSSRFYNEWHLKNPFNLSIASGHIVATPFCWQSNATGKVCGHFDLGKTRWDITLNSQQFPYEILASLFPSRLKIDTLLNTDIALSQFENNAIRGHLHLNTSSGKILYFDPDVEIPAPLYFDQLRFFADFDKNMQSSLILKANEKTPIDIQLNLPSYEKYYSDFGHQKIEGFIKVSLDSFSKLPGLFSQFKKFDGVLQSNVKLSGTLKDPVFTGNTALTNVNALLNPYNTAIQGFNLNLNFSHQDVNINGRGRIGDGALTLKGNSSVFDPYNLSLMIEGEHLGLANTNEYQLTASPNIKITFKKPIFSVTGSIDIPSATISPQKFDTVTTMPATVIITRGNARILPEKKWLQFWMNLKLSLGNAINLNVKGLTGNVVGNLTVVEKPDLPITAAGELTITNGKYEAYGEKLNIDRGRLIFSNGPIFNPGLDIQASKTIQQMAMAPTTTTPQTNVPFSNITSLTSMSLPEIPSTGTQKITVGIKVLGTQDDPVVSLFSIPGGLTDTDILSYLLLGVRSSQASQAQGQLLLIAANALGFSGSSVTDGIEHSLGFSEFGLESSTVIDTNQKQPTPQQNTSFAVGKFITPRVYVHYSMGILIPINILNIRYLLTKRISLQSETSTLGNGVDVFYTIEK